MEIRYLILTRYGEFAPDGTLYLIGGDHDKYIAEDYPHVQQHIVAVARVVLGREDSGVEHPFRSIIIDDETKDVIAEGASGVLPPLAIPDDVEFLGTGMILGFPNVIIPKQGLYRVQLLIDDAVAGSARFRVAPFAFFRSRQALLNSSLGGSSNA